jgi:hypothetical protein
MADTDVETVTLTVAADGVEEALTVPRGLFELIGEDGETPPEAVANLSMLSLANRVHHLVHHHDGEVDPEVSAIEAATLELFEERFGMTFGEATGHQH